jgi:NOL1/NOP2/fmu family ribosome biogenesis protein
MASQNKHRRFFRSQDQERVKEPEHEEIGKIQLNTLINYLHDLYGIDKKVFDDFLLMKLGKDVWITNKATKNFLAFKNKLRINSLGIRAIRNAFDVPKLTTNFAIFLNDKITKNYYDMNEKELDEYIHGYEINFPENKKGELKNYLIMKHKNQVYGVGLIIENKIKSQVPKGRKLKNQLSNTNSEEVIDE